MQWKLNVPWTDSCAPLDLPRQRAASTFGVSMKSHSWCCDEMTAAACSRNWRCSHHPLSPHHRKCPHAQTPTSRQSSWHFDGRTCFVPRQEQEEVWLEGLMWTGCQQTQRSRYLWWHCHQSLLSSQCWNAWRWEPVQISPEQGQSLHPRQRKQTEHCLTWTETWSGFSQL